MFDSKDWITIIGIGLTFFVSSISLYVSLTNNKKTLFINSITSSRIQWISIIRENIAKFCGLTFHYTLTDLSKSEKQKVLEELDKVKYLIKLQLNREDEFDKMIINKLNTITNLTDPKKIEKLEAEIDELVSLTQDLLKLEWEGAKLESMKGILPKEEKDKLYEKHLKIKKQTTTN